MPLDITTRLNASKEIATAAGATALDYFNSLDTLNIEAKGHQDMVTQADRNVETQTRAALAAAFPDDAIVGEEHAPTPGTSGFTWVIDPIDGTANFVAGIPAWVVVIAGVYNGKIATAAIHDPIHNVTYWAQSGGGAFMNDTPMQVSKTTRLSVGSVGVGFSNRSAHGTVIKLITALLNEGGLFYRNASGALSLAYVAAGNLIGYAEDHMNAWDCLAGQLLVQEAGGKIENQNADEMTTNGGRVIVGAPGIYDELLRISEAAFAP